LSDDFDSVVVCLEWEREDPLDTSNDQGRWKVSMADEDASYFWVSETMDCRTAFDTTIELFHTLEYGGSTPPGSGTVHVEPLGVL
jgi:hypothetical protein